MSQPFDLSGLRVLIAEDEPLIAMMLEEMLADMGCIIAGSHATLGDLAVASRTDAFDVALIDMNLGGETSEPVIEDLAARGVPCAIASGADAGGASGEAIHLRKPFGQDQLLATMIELQRRL